MSSPDPSSATKSSLKSPPPSASSATLAPPATISRPSSANSSRSSTSRRRKGGKKSGSVSPSGSDRNGNRVVVNGQTTTVSGGVKLGGGQSSGKSTPKQESPPVPSTGGAAGEKKDVKDAGNQAKGKAKKGGGNGQQQKNSNGNRANSRPQPIDTGAPARPTSQNSTKSETAPRSLHAHVSPPRTALDAAFEAAHQKHNDIGGGDALTSLQKMISDLKAISPSAITPSSSSIPSGTGSGRSMSMSQGDKLSVPGSATSASAKKLKADAPTFMPTMSPGGSNSSLSPSNAIPAAAVQPRAASFAAGSQGRRASRNSMSANPTADFISPVSGSFSAGLVRPNPLAGLAEIGENPFGIDFAYQQQLLAAQYQQIQLLQAQIQANQLAQQQSQQQQQQYQQQQGSFIAPRFQALAAQRIQQQQDQQAQLYQAHAQASQMYQMQQQQLLDQHTLAHQRVESSDAPAVFEEDSPEQKPVPLGTSGRPQLNPNFTFGAKRQAAERQSMSPPSNAPVINRSEGIGGAAATGLAGLAARAHKRTGSEITPAMQEQLDIQSQIEALQAKQKALMDGDRSSALNQLSDAIHKRAPSIGHRRAQSSVIHVPEQPPIRAVQEEPAVSQPRQVVRGFGEMPPPPVPVSSSHSRRHSTAVTKGHRGSTYGSAFGSMSSDMPDDSLNAIGHHRTGSRSGFESGNWRSVAAGPVTDLASAQAQLQSLAQFRAAAGGGHQKMASFAFPNMMPNLLAATTLQAPAGQSLIEQQQAFQMQLQQSAHGPQRKSLFAPYLPQASLPPLLQAGKLVVGILRVNKKNRSDAYVATDVLEADIYICGSKDRNRALEGDIVAIELLDVDEVWGTKKEKEDKKRRKEENAAYDLKPSTVKRFEKKKDDVEVEGQGMTLFDDEEVDDNTKPTYAGHVVAVVERMPGQLFSGQLGVLRPSSAATKEKQEVERREREGDRHRRDEPESRPKIVWFKPTDKRVPLIAIPTEQAPSDFLTNSEAYSERLFVATIKRWPITSLHPFGTLVEELGPIGDAEVETSALLKDCNFPTEEFNDLAIKCLPPLPWTIPEREFEIRKDLRSDRVFTIDPATAKDLDDALSIKKNEDGSFDVNVHIADVTYFVKPHTPLDREARKRATSVYLVQRAVPMLPPQLSEELCSLVPGEERLAFTASFKFDADANVTEKSFSRTIIKSCAKLAYSDAQDVISGSKLSAMVDGDHKVSDVEEDLKNLASLATKLRERRVAAGAMLSKKLKIKFSLDDKLRPFDCEPQSPQQANHLVEEFMLLTNVAVSQFIANGLPETALLRRHEAPLERRLEGFVSRAKKLGFEMDGSSAGALQKSFDKVEDPNALLCLELLKRKSMQSARYFCTGMLDIAKYSHYALSVPVYTHFTSPIRRYADVLVHRMLDACISGPNPNDVKFYMDRDQVAKAAQQCNMKKQGAKLAEDQSVHLHLCMLIHDLTLRYGPVVREGKVTGVLDAAFDVVIPEYGLEKRVHVDKMPLSNTVYDEHKDVLSLYWTKQDTISYLAQDSDDPHIKKIKSLSDRRATGTLTTQSTDTDALFSSAATSTDSSKQYAKSANEVQIEYQGLRSSGGHKIQDIKELMSVPVIITSDMTKSPPVLVVYAKNPYA